MTDTTLMTADTPTDEAASQTAGDVANNDATAQQPVAEAAPTDPVGGEQAQQAEGDKADDAPQGAPEAYEDFSVPEGVELDAELLGEFKNVAKELNLPIRYCGIGEQAEDLVVFDPRLFIEGLFD